MTAKQYLDEQVKKGILKWWQQVDPKDETRFIIKFYEKVSQQSQEVPTNMQRSTETQ